MASTLLNKNSPRTKRRIEADPEIAGFTGEFTAPEAKKLRTGDPAEEKAEVKEVELRKGRGRPRSKKPAATEPKKNRGGKSGTRARDAKKPKQMAIDNLCEKDEIFDLGEEEEEEKEEEEGVAGHEKREDEVNKRRKGVQATKKKDNDVGFFGEPVPKAEARERWPSRYTDKSAGKLVSTSNGGEGNCIVKAKCHFLKARVDGILYDLYDDAYVKAEDGEADYIGRIVEFFQSCDNKLYFTCQWFFRAEDTVITKEHVAHHDSRRVFLSNEKDDNTLDCIVSKVQIVRVSTETLLDKEVKIPNCELYYDMSYSMEYSTFSNLLPEARRAGSGTSCTISENAPSKLSSGMSGSNCGVLTDDQTSELSLLDLYSGCGAMSTGLCLGANLSGVKLRTYWAIDFNVYACESLKLNHPDAEVRNEKAEDFLALIKEWHKLCKEFGLFDEKVPTIETNDSEDEDDPEDSSSPSDEFEVGKLVGICYGTTDNINKVGLKFKVRWKGYGPEDDTWEPITGLSKCEERIQAFVRRGYLKNILPLPGRVDVLCGGPPCQGASGYNRFRNFKNPLEDEKNKQVVVYMDIVDFLRPKFVLMENVVDILKFSSAYLGKYALSRLVCMKYQARLGIMAAGRYGLPQCRNRVFLWGAHHTENLPQFPLGSHRMTARGVCPTEFERNIVFFNTNQETLENALILGDAISDLPTVENDERRDEMAYGNPPQTYFQTCIRLSRADMENPLINVEDKSLNSRLFDHRPLQLNADDYQRVCRIPKRKGANFRDLPGVMVRADNVVEWDPNVERVKLPSGKPLVPDYAMTYVKGKSVKPFGRLWWDDTVPTVVTRAEPHNQVILHPDQDRVLTIRENARLQGFPDYYQLCGPVKERYMQVGNAVAVPVSRALGYALGFAFLHKSGYQPTFCLPPKFPFHQSA